MNKMINMLFVDDEELVLQVTKLYLQNTNINPVFAKNGKECIEQLIINSYKFDLILLDLMMPDIDGITLLTQIKHDPLGAKIPVILQTGVMNFSFLKINHLAADILKKPYSKDDMLSVIYKNLLKD